MESNDNNQYKVFFNNTPLPYQSLLPNGEFKEINQTWLNTLGYKRNEIIGNNFVDFLHPDSKPIFQKSFRKLKKEGEVHNIRFKIRHKKGHYLNIAFDGKIDYDEKGKMKQSYCVFKDITKQSEAELALYKSEKKFKSLFDAMIEGVALHEMVFDKNRQPANYLILNVNRQFSSILKLKKHLVVGKLATEAYNVKTPPYLDKYAWVIEKKKSIKFETWFEPMNKHFLISAFSLHTNQFATIFEDITRQKLSYEKLKASEERFRSLSQTATDAIITADSQGIIIEWNNGAKNIFGYEAREIKNQSVKILMSRKYWSIHKEVFDGIAGLKSKFKRTKALELDALHKDGHEFPIELSLSQWKSQGSIFITAIIRDISLRKQTEMELMIHHQNLEKMVAERTKELEKTNKELDEFNKLFVGREFRIKELKDKVKALENELEGYKNRSSESM